MFGIGMPEMIIILIIILVVFGVGKLPEIGSGIGLGIRNFKQGALAKTEGDTELEGEKTLEEEKMNQSDAC